LAPAMTCSMVCELAGELHPHHTNAQPKTNATALEVMMQPRKVGISASPLLVSLSY